uniref:PHD-type domain-containing protein n=2 Tax=Odontella aurita TaxID=265563 RepID=A0A7S4IQS3_9STRA
MASPLPEQPTRASRGGFPAAAPPAPRSTRSTPAPSPPTSTATTKAKAKAKSKAKSKVQSKAKAPPALETSAPASKRGPGRPRKNQEPPQPLLPPPEPPKRGSGRPKKQEEPFLLGAKAGTTRAVISAAAEAAAVAATAPKARVKRKKKVLKKKKKPPREKATPDAFLSVNAPGSHGSKVSETFLAGAMTEPSARVAGGTLPVRVGNLPEKVRSIPKFERAGPALFAFPLSSAGLSGVGKKMAAVRPDAAKSSDGKDGPGPGPHPSSSAADGSLVRDLVSFSDTRGRASVPAAEVTQALEAWHHRKGHRATPQKGVGQAEPLSALARPKPLAFLPAVPLESAEIMNKPIIEAERRDGGTGGGGDSAPTMTVAEAVKAAQEAAARKKKKKRPSSGEGESSVMSSPKGPQSGLGGGGGNSPAAKQLAKWAAALPGSKALPVFSSGEEKEEEKEEVAVLANGPDGVAGGTAAAAEELKDWAALLGKNKTGSVAGGAGVVDDSALSLAAAEGLKDWAASLGKNKTGSVAGGAGAADDSALSPAAAAAPAPIPEDDAMDAAAAAALPSDPSEEGLSDSTDQDGADEVSSEESAAAVAAPAAEYSTERICDGEGADPMAPTLVGGDAPQDASAVDGPALALSASAAAPSEGSSPAFGMIGMLGIDDGDGREEGEAAGATASQSPGEDLVAAAGARVGASGAGPIQEVTDCVRSLVASVEERRDATGTDRTEDAPTGKEARVLDPAGASQGVFPPGFSPFNNPAMLQQQYQAQQPFPPPQAFPGSPFMAPPQFGQFQQPPGYGWENNGQGMPPSFPGAQAQMVPPMGVMMGPPMGSSMGMGYPMGGPMGSPIGGAPIGSPAGYQRVYPPVPSQGGQSATQVPHAAVYPPQQQPQPAPPSPPKPKGPILPENFRSYEPPPFVRPKLDDDVDSAAKTEPGAFRPSNGDSRITVPPSVDDAIARHLAARTAKKEEGAKASEKAPAPAAAAAANPASSKLVSTPVGTSSIGGQVVANSVVAPNDEPAVRGAPDTPRSGARAVTAASNRELASAKKELETEKERDPPHLRVIAPMRRGVPHHLLPLESKLAMLEYLLDELLNTGPVLSDLAKRKRVTDCYRDKYGPLPTPRELDDLNNVDDCTVCGREGDLLCCDGCTGSYHRKCVDINANQELGEGAWLCPECSTADSGKFGSLKGGRKPTLDWIHLEDLGYGFEGESLAPALTLSTALVGAGTIAPGVQVQGLGVIITAAKPTISAAIAAAPPSALVPYTGGLGASQQAPKKFVDKRLKGVEFLVIHGYVFARHKGTREPFVPPRAPPAAKNASKKSEGSSAPSQIGGEAGMKAAAATAVAVDGMGVDKSAGADGMAIDKSAGADGTDKHKVADGSRVKEEILNGAKEKAPPPLEPSQLMDLLKLLGPDVCATWPWCQIPFNPSKVWNSKELKIYNRKSKSKAAAKVKAAAEGAIVPYDPKELTRISLENRRDGYARTFALPDAFSPLAYVNHYRGAPAPLHVRETPILRQIRSDHTHFESASLNCRVANLSNVLTRDLSCDDVVCRVLREDKGLFDPLQPLREYMTKLEKSLSRGSLLEERWGLRNADLDSEVWSKNVRRCCSSKRLALLIVKLIDVTHSRAFDEDWFRLPGQRGTSDHSALVGGNEIRAYISLPDGWDIKKEIRKRQWERSSTLGVLRLIKSDSEEKEAILGAIGANTTTCSHGRKGKKGAPLAAPAESEKAVSQPVSQDKEKCKVKLNPPASLKKAADKKSAPKKGGSSPKAASSKKASSKIPQRNKSAYIHYHMAMHAKAKKLGKAPPKASDFNKAISAQWKKMDEKDKKKWKTMAEKDKNRYLKEMAEAEKRIKEGHEPKGSEEKISKDGKRKADASHSRSKKEKRARRSTGRKSMLQDEIQSDDDGELVKVTKVDADTLLNKEKSQRVQELRKLVDDSGFDRQINWPLAGRKLFDPKSCLSQSMVKWLGRSAGCKAVPHLTYTPTFEVGRPAMCHVWRRKTLECNSIETLAMQLRCLDSFLNKAAIITCEGITKRNKPNAKKVIKCSLRDHATGLTEYFVVDKNNTRGLWASEDSIDLPILIHHRIKRIGVHRAKFDKFVTAKRMREEEERRLESERQRKEAEARKRREMEERKRRRLEEEARKREEQARRREEARKAAAEAAARARERARELAEKRLQAAREAAAKKAVAKAERERIAAEKRAAKAREKAEKKAAREAAAKARAEREAKARAEREAKARAEREAAIARAEKLRAEREARAKAEREAKAKAEAEARAKAERAAKERAEREAREAKARAEREARAKAERKAREAKDVAEREAKARAEQEAKAQAMRFANSGAGGLGYPMRSAADAQMALHTATDRHRDEVKKLLKEAAARGQSSVATELMNPTRLKHMAELKAANDVLRQLGGNFLQESDLTQKLCEAETEAVQGYVKEMQNPEPQNKKARKNSYTNQGAHTGAAGTQYQAQNQNISQQSAYSQSQTQSAAAAPQAQNVAKAAPSAQPQPRRTSHQEQMQPAAQHFGDSQYGGTYQQEQSSASRSQLSSYQRDTHALPGEPQARQPRTNPQQSGRGTSTSPASYNDMASSNLTNRSQLQASQTEDARLQTTYPQERGSVVDYLSRENDSVLAQQSWSQRQTLAGGRDPTGYQSQLQQQDSRLDSTGLASSLAGTTAASSLAGTTAGIRSELLNSQLGLDYLTGGGLAGGNAYDALYQDQYKAPSAAQTLLAEGVLAAQQQMQQAQYPPAAAPGGLYQDRAAAPGASLDLEPQPLDGEANAALGAAYGGLDLGQGRQQLNLTDPGDAYAQPYGSSNQASSQQGGAYSQYQNYFQ